MYTTRIYFRMKADNKRIEDVDPATYATSEKYYRRFANDDDEEMDVNSLGLSSHS